MFVKTGDTMAQNGCEKQGYQEWNGYACVRALQHTAFLNVEQRPYNPNPSISTKRIKNIKKKSRDKCMLDLQ